MRKNLNNYEIIINFPGTLALEFSGFILISPISRSSMYLSSNVISYLGGGVGKPIES